MILKAKNGVFTVDETTGYLTHIAADSDPSVMNYADEQFRWGYVRDFDEILGVKITGDSIVSSYKSRRGLMLNVTRFINDGGNFEERYDFVNQSSAEFFFTEGELGIFFPASCCLDETPDFYHTRVGAHILCADDMAYIRMQKIAGTMTLSFEYIFTAEDEHDLLCARPSCIVPTADRYSIFPGETAAVSCAYNMTGDAISVTCGGKELPYAKDGDHRFAFTVPGDAVGEKRVRITVDGKSTYIVLNVLMPYEDLLDARAAFIAHKQQYHRAGICTRIPYTITARRSRSIRR